MKALIATLILTIGLLGCVTTKQKQAQVEQAAWLNMCQLLIDEGVGYHCARLKLPLTVYEPMRAGLSGYYNGGDTIFINSALVGWEVDEVLMHEQIHYVHVQLQMIPVPGPADQICWSENEAWTLTGTYYGIDNSKWWRAYPHCWAYYGDTQKLRDIGYIYNQITDIIDGIIFTTPGE